MLFSKKVKILAQISSPCLGHLHTGNGFLSVSAGPARRRERGGGARLSPARHGACPRGPVGPGPASRRARQEGSGVSPACGSAFGPRPVGPRTDAARPGTDLPRGRPGAGLGSPGPRARGGGRLCAGAACGPSGAAGPGGRRGPAGTSRGSGSPAARPQGRRGVSGGVWNPRGFSGQNPVRLGQRPERKAS